MGTMLDTPKIWQDPDLVQENIPAEILEYAFSSKQKDAIIEMTQIFDLLCERTCQSYDETH